MTFIQAFDNIKEKLIKADTSKLSGNFAVQVNMKNKDCGGTYYIAFIDGQLDVQPYDYRDRNVMITAMAGDILKLADGRLDPVKAIESGKIEVEGDLTVAVQLAGIITPEPAKKPAVKKAEPKKAATKTTAAKTTANTTAKASTKTSK